MKKNILLLASMCLLVGACESLAPRTPPQAKLPPLDKVVPCPPGGSKVITIVTSEAAFSVAPPHLCIVMEADKDAEIKVNFAGNPAANLVSLKAKPFVDAPWLSATNPGGRTNQATITVPAGTAHGTYFYTVTAIGWGTIDPMISVDD
jgi:hypothetical protein